MREKIYLVRTIARELGYQPLDKNKEVKLAMHYTKESLKLILRRVYDNQKQAS